MNGLYNLLKESKKQLLLILLFYFINFGLWEVIAPIVTQEWASFIVYLVLFLFTLGFFSEELRDEWRIFKSSQLQDKGFYFRFVVWFLANFLLGVLLIYVAQKLKINILPENSEHVKEQIARIPVALAVVQGCIFAPLIEESVFRYAMIGKNAKGMELFLRVILSIILFDVIHILSFSEFFYYLLPSLILTTFYLKYRNVFASIFLHSLINILGYILLIVGVL